jgi:dihydropteroate synthase
MDSPEQLAARYNVRSLLPGPEEGLREAVARVGVDSTQLQVLARFAAHEVLAIQGLGADQTRVIERCARRSGGEVLSSVDGDRIVVFMSLLEASRLPDQLAEWSERTGEVGAAIRAALTARGSPPPIRAGAQQLRFDRTLVMGIINATPDSFSGDGVGSDVGRARDMALRMQEEGADIIDVGAESTRPNSARIDESEELQRLRPVWRAVRDAVRVPLSVDTRHSAVAAVALDEGAVIVNDVWGLRADPAMATLVARHGDIAVVVMHNQQGTEYRDLLAEVSAALRQSLAIAVDAGIPATQVICDPGFGFGKTPAQNLELLRRLGELRSIGRPLLAGVSRKSTIAALLESATEPRLEGSIAMAVLAVANGAGIIRAHDVGATVRALRVADGVVRGTPAALRALPAPGPTG